ncbi:hypothetical protein [Legionella brunensis]|uniref:Lipase (Class 3) n=1 Tax=Legionella brunensis TaxID=29422 RepID=A0A0W0SSE0_9GAMM|nr:hypothetical protein [Legionella brunensis]KTC86310.1 Lipase (class 3) [Legionella brunensis]
MPLTVEQKTIIQKIKESSPFLDDTLTLKAIMDESGYGELAQALAMNHNFIRFKINNWVSNEKAIEQIASALKESSESGLKFIWVESTANILECVALIQVLQNKSLEKLLIEDHKIDSVDDCIILIRAFTRLFKANPTDKKILIEINGRFSSPEIIKNLESNVEVRQALSEMLKEMSKSSALVQFYVPFINSLSVGNKVEKICERNRSNFQEKEIEEKFKQIERRDEDGFKNQELIKELKEINTQLKSLSSLMLDFSKNTSQGDELQNKELIQSCQKKVMRAVIRLADEIHPPKIGFVLEECHSEIAGALNDLKKLTFAKASEKVVIENLITKMTQTENHLRVATEKEHVISGWYQRELYEFTYEYRHYNKKSKNVEVNLSRESVLKRVNNTGASNTESTYQVCLLMNEPAFRCTASIPNKIENPLEIQINFFGTIDFASKSVALDEGGPGQELIKKHEEKLLEQVNFLMEQISLIHPGQTFRLRIAGHSLGGALAKAFTHTVQRGIAVQDREPGEIIKRISSQYSDSHQHQQELIVLERNLEQDKEKFCNNKQLKKIEGITLYALGAPGIGKEMDAHASLMTYDQNSNFLRAYHHQHEEDIITRFGETEFLSGTRIKPNINVNLHIVYKVKIKESELRYERLPFPGCDKKVMAAHNKLIFGLIVESMIQELSESNLAKKFEFHPLRYSLYRGIKDVAVLCAKNPLFFKTIDSLSTLPTSKTEFPVLGEEAFQDSISSDEMKSEADLPSDEPKKKDFLK